MTAIVLWAVLGAALSAAVWAPGQTMFDVGPLERLNYRKARIVTGVGIIVPVVMLVLVSFALLWDRIAPSVATWSFLLWPSLVAALGFSLLGLLDDVAGQDQSGGFRGHLAELRRGRLSSGLVKLGGGAALGVVVAAPLWHGPPGASGVAALLRDGAVVALAANLANLFDRAPGRMLKVVGVTFGLAALVSRSPSLAVPAGGVGAGLGLLRADLTERCMLGDAGANPLGALCGLAALAAAPDPLARWALLGVVLLGNVTSEVISFSSVIDSVAPLRWFDRLGSQRGA